MPLNLGNAKLGSQVKVVAIRAETFSFVSLDDFTLERNDIIIALVVIDNSSKLIIVLEVLDNSLRQNFNLNLNTKTSRTSNDIYGNSQASSKVVKRQSTHFRLFFFHFCQRKKGKNNSLQVIPKKSYTRSKI